MLKSGMVMSLEGNKAIVMTPDGEFCGVTAPPGTEVGSVLEWSSADVRRRVHTSLRPKSWGGRIRYTALGMAAAMVVAVGMWQVGLHEANQQPYAYVALDISPGVTLTVNRRLNVIHATGLDAAGQSLIAASNTSTALTTAIQNLVMTAQTKHMVPRHDNILIATAPGSGTTNEAMSAVEHVVKTSVRQALGDHTNKVPSDHVYTYQVSDTVWNAATQLNVSPAKVAAYLTEVNNGHEVPFNQLHLARLSEKGSSSAGTSMVMVRLDNLQAVESLIESAISQMKTGSAQPSDISGGSTESSMGLTKTQTSSTKQGTMGSWSIV